MVTSEVITPITVMLYNEYDGKVSKETFHGGFDELYSYLNDNPTVQLMEIL